MALLGTGAICIWNDITAEGRADFYAWHVQEHIPERVGIPGFLRGRRYVAAIEGTGPEFFTLYEVETPSVLFGHGYRSRLDAPTPWTKRATSGFRNTSRALTSVQATLGIGSGGALATLRLAPLPHGEDALRSQLADQVLPSLTRMAKITGAHLCVTDLGASAGRSAETRDRADILEPPAWIVLIEGCNPHAVVDAMRDCGTAVTDLIAGPSVMDAYHLEYSLQEMESHIAR